MNHPNRSPKLQGILVPMRIRQQNWISKYSRAVDNTKATRTGDHLYEELKRLKKEVALLTRERNLLRCVLGVKKADANPSASLRTGFAKDH
jgi:hypothetical protein